MRLINKIFLFFSCATLLLVKSTVTARVAATTAAKAEGQTKTLFWLNLLPLASRIQADEANALANRNTTSALSDDYTLNNGVAADEVTQVARPDLYPALVPIYRPSPYVRPYLAPYVPLPVRQPLPLRQPAPLRQPILSDQTATTDDTVIRTEFIKGILAGLQGDSSAADMKTDTSELHRNKLLRASARRLSSGAASEGATQSRRKLPFVLLDDGAFKGGAHQGNKKILLSTDTEHNYDVYEILVL